MTQKVYVEISTKLHKEVKALAAAEGKLLPTVYTEALQRHLEWKRGGGREASRFGDVTTEEAEVLDALLAWMRSADARESFIFPALQALRDQHQKTRR